IALGTLRRSVCGPDRAALINFCLQCRGFRTSSGSGRRITASPAVAPHFQRPTVAVIQTGKLVKHYRSVEALKGVSLQVDKGEIYGLLGQNGAGKTTLIKILLGITKATDGTAQLLGEPVGTPNVRKRVGYLPEDHRFPDYHTGYSLLDFYGSLLS